MTSDSRSTVSGPCLNRTFNAFATGAVAGTFFGSCQLVWYPDPVTSTSPTKRFSAAGKPAAMRMATTDLPAIIRTLSRPTFWMASTATAFAVAECTAEAARGTSDAFNAAIGGMAGGAVIGSMSRNAGIMISSALGMGLFMFAFEFAGGSSALVLNAEQKAKKAPALPKTHVEGDALASLKEKYPKFKNL